MYGGRLTRGPLLAGLYWLAVVLKAVVGRHGRARASYLRISVIVKPGSAIVNTRRRAGAERRAEFHTMEEIKEMVLGRWPPPPKG